MEDTIAAVATAYGEGSIGIIRISGQQAFSILKKVFVPANGRNIESRKLTYGHVVDYRKPEGEGIIDEVLSVYMKGPHTYTAEDVVEINCHGSMVSLRKTLDLVIQSGARMAEPGEFTKRAFLNGRLDLSQAEAVMDLISAKTDKGFDSALNQLSGSLSEEIREIRGLLMDQLVDITVNIDYPDEDIEVIVYDKFKNKLQQVVDRIVSLISSMDVGKIIKEGFNLVIVGKPNVGKSSFMNAILKENRAIVTDVPGTTRDTIVEDINLKGIPIKLTDTAGIRKTNDKVEMIGIEKSMQSFNDADLVLFIMDASRDIDQEDKNIIEAIGDKKAIVLMNKQDLGSSLVEKDLDELKSAMPNARFIETSVIKGEGVSLVEDEIENMVYKGDIRQGGKTFVTNVRHGNLLKDAEKSLRDAINMVSSGEALEFVEVDVKTAWESLGEIIGESVSENIIDEVFSRFCLGK